MIQQSWKNGHFMCQLGSFLLARSHFNALLQLFVFKNYVLFILIFILLLGALLHDYLVMKVCSKIAHKAVDKDKFD